MPPGPFSAKDQLEITSLGTEFALLEIRGTISAADSNKCSSTSSPLKLAGLTTYIENGEYS